jgi:hypothetical protein
VLVLDIIKILLALIKYKYDTWRILPVKCYIDNSLRLQGRIGNIKTKGAPVPLRVLWFRIPPLCPRGSGAATRLWTLLAVGIKKYLATLGVQRGSQVTKACPYVACVFIPLVFTSTKLIYIPSSGGLI